MSNKNYYNSKGDSLYVLHFPGGSMNEQQKIIDREINREIHISDNLSIISIMNKNCFCDSPLVKQCENNDIKIYNSALEETKKWNNTLKINHILECLNEIKTDYVLILDGRDTLIVNDLDDNFVSKFLTFNYPIIYNGTIFAHPQTPIESITEIIKIKGKYKFLNAGVCIGRKDELINFYELVEDFNMKNPLNHSEQLLVRKARLTCTEKVFWDTEGFIFRTLHSRAVDYDINEKDNGDIIII